MACARSMPARQDEAEPRSADQVLLNLDSAAVKLDEGLDQAEPQADSTLAKLIVTGGVVERIEPGEKWLEKVLLLAGMDAGTLIPNEDANPFRVSWHCLHQDVDRALIGSELDGVAEQVDQDVHAAWKQSASIGLNSGSIRISTRCLRASR